MLPHQITLITLLLTLVRQVKLFGFLRAKSDESSPKTGALMVNGVNSPYTPYTPRRGGAAFPSPSRVQRDFDQIAEDRLAQHQIRRATHDKRFANIWHDPLEFAGAAPPERAAFRAQAFQCSRGNDVNALDDGAARGHRGLEFKIARLGRAHSFKPILDRPRANKRRVEFDQFGVAMRFIGARGKRRERRQRETGGERAAGD